MWLLCYDGCRVLHCGKGAPVQKAAWIKAICSRLSGGASAHQSNMLLTSTTYGHHPACNLCYHMPPFCSRELCPLTCTASAAASHADADMQLLHLCPTCTSAPPALAGIHPLEALRACAAAAPAVGHHPPPPPQNAAQMAAAAARASPPRHRWHVHCQEWRSASSGASLELGMRWHAPCQVQGFGHSASMARLPTSG